MNQDRELTYVTLNEQVTLQNQDPVLNECAARLGVSLDVLGDIKLCLNKLGTLTALWRRQSEGTCYKSDGL
jgi:hypothetical protein